MLEDYDEPIDQFNALCDCGDNSVSEFIFIHPYGSSELVVTDEDETEEYYCDDEYEFCPNYGLMSMEEAEDNYDDDEEELRSYKVFLNAEFGDDYNRELNKGIKTINMLKVYTEFHLTLTQHPTRIPIIPIISKCMLNNSTW